MPKYLKAKVDRLVTREEVEKMVAATPDQRDKALIIFLYLFGPRPSEVLDMRTSDIVVEPTKIIAKIPTKKLGKRSKYKLTWRILAVRRPHPRDWLIEELVKYIRLMQASNPEGRLFPISRRTLNYIVEKWSKKVLGEVLAPYNFRHTRMTLLARAGATIDEMMHWKGALDVRSVSPYLHGRPFAITETRTGEVIILGDGEELRT